MYTSPRPVDTVVAYGDDHLEQIFDYGGGECACCRKQLSYSNYGSFGRRGAWEVDHRVPLSHGGSDNLRNLRPMCIPCNRAKGNQGFRSYCGGQR